MASSLREGYSDTRINSEESGSFLPTPAALSEPQVDHGVYRDDEQTPPHTFIHNLFHECAQGLEFIDLDKLTAKTIAGVQGTYSTEELELWAIQNTAMFISEEPEYSRLAARLLDLHIQNNLQHRNIHSFSDSIAYGSKVGLIADEVTKMVADNADFLNSVIDPSRSDLFEYFGLRTVYDRYLLKDPESREVIESPQHFMMRVSCGLSHNATEAVEFYKLISSFQYLPSTPTLFNSATKHPQMSSCYLLDSPNDSLEDIYSRYTDIALLSKYAGGIGVGYSRVRSRGSQIRGTNGKSNGIVPFLKTLDSSVAAVNQGGKRKGAACVYLEPWHADIMEFLELRDNTGDEAQRTHNLNLANWIPDIFMRRVEANEHWSLFDPQAVPNFTDLFGTAFDKAYEAAEAAGLAVRTVPARDIYARMMKTLAQTGNGWMTFKDASNQKSNQTLKPENVIHLSNLCTEILEVTSKDETAVCNLGSLNLGMYVKGDLSFDFELLGKNVRTAVKYLDRVIDINFYPIDAAQGSNSRWRPVGLGTMGLQNVFFKMRIPFDSAKAIEITQQIFEEIYFHALSQSNALAEKNGPHASFAETRASQGELQFDLWGTTPRQPQRWTELKRKIAQHGLRNSLLIAIAPTATIASISGAYECIEPQLSNLFKRETLSGEFLQINPFLVRDLRKLGLWSQSMRDRIKMAEGSVQSIQEIPVDLRRLYRTVWEVPQKALIDLAAARGPYIDQSQSLNLFLENPTLGKISSMYLYAWKKGLKTCYYLRSRGATKINKTTISQPNEKSAIACSLENPETCESCT
ncbi:MAG: ribonucleoside-diphosphate reductase subunit alpha [Zetaproteobacteria bacterium]|nr:ribonucleoside-diphosphate reductase subunit alpha [Zetaproteobacteria bacterium]